MNIRKILIIALFIFLIPMLGWISPNKNNVNINRDLYSSKNNIEFHNTIENKKSYIDNLLKSKVKIKIGDDIVEDTVEEYLIGVTAAEISPTYELEAIKAQMVAAHTYAINKYGESGPYPADPCVFQAYINKEGRKEKYKDNFNEYEQILKDIAASVVDKIIVYDDKPIVAAFHSMSGGVTKSSEEVWGSFVPYLTSTDSSVETTLQNYTTQKIKNITESYNLIKSKYAEAQMPQEHNNIIKIVSKTESGYVKNAQIFGVELPGSKIRSIFGLPSSDFSVSIDNCDIIFTCKGNGHGVGMSQQGANELAKQGKTYEEILCHYYNGVSIKSL